MKGKLTHNQLKKFVTEYLELHHFIVVNVYAGGGVNSKGQYFRRKNVVGVSDLICQSLSGTFWAVEIKIGADKLSTEQQNFLKNVGDRNGIGVVVRKPEDIELYVQNYGK